MNRILTFISSQKPDDATFDSWVRRTYPGAKSSRTIRLYKSTLDNHLRLIEKVGSRYKLTMLGARYLKTRDADIVFQSLLNFSGVKKILDLLEESGPLTSDEIHQKLGFESRWGKVYTRRGLAWLESFGKVRLEGNRFFVNHSSRKNLSFEMRDFQRLANGSIEDVVKVKRKFDALADILEDKARTDPQLGLFVYYSQKNERRSPYVSKYSKQGAKRKDPDFLKRTIWIGLGHKKYRDFNNGNPRYGVQFQFGVYGKEVHHYGIWMEGDGKYRGVGKRTAKNIEEFGASQAMGRILRLGQGYEVFARSFKEKGPIRKDANKLSEEDFDKILFWFKHHPFHFSLKRKIEPLEFIALRNPEEDFIKVMKELLPVYRIFEGLERSGKEQPDQSGASVQQTKLALKKALEELQAEQTEQELRKSSKIDAMSDDELNKFIESKERSGGLEKSRKSATVTVSYRDPELAAAMKKRANYTCQICGQPTFEGKDGHNYTECHHVIPRGNNGPDSPGNIVIVCPTCHRKFDSGSEKTMIELYKKIKEKGLFSDFETLRRLGVISDVIYSKVINTTP